MANDDAYTTVTDFKTCAVQGTRIYDQTKLLQFPAAKILEFVEADILGLLQKTKLSNQEVILLEERSNKWPWAILVTTVTSTNAATVFADNWVIPFEILIHLLTEIRQMLVMKLFAADSVRWSINQLITTAYHPQTNGQIESFDRTIVVHLKNYVAEHQN